jgi:hypothetical protein
MCHQGWRSHHVVTSKTPFTQPIAELLLGGIGAFVRTYRVWRAGGRWWIWQGAGWFLLVLMLLELTMTAPMALG